jgi:hypothetical protein
MLEGKKTWIGLIIMVLGMVGVGYLINADQLAQLIDAGLKIVGIVIAVYGNYKAHEKIAPLKAETMLD